MYLVVATDDNRMSQWIFPRKYYYSWEEIHERIKHQLEMADALKQVITINIIKEK